jgi:hypothetical protein
MTPRIDTNVIFIGGKMSINSKVAQQFRKYIHESEEILATISSQPAVGGETERLCITSKRLCSLQNLGLFRWRYQNIGFDRISNVAVEEGWLRSTIILLIKNFGERRLLSIGKDDARDFVGILNSCIEQNNEVFSQRTKVCPACNELVKYLARKCKYCGHDFE